MFCLSHGKKKVLLAACFNFKYSSVIFNANLSMAFELDPLRYASLWHFCFLRGGNLKYAVVFIIFVFLSCLFISFGVIPQ